ncbi:MAG: dihydrofolate reductase [Gemmatimonadetes bacterium]|nr:dihydrofolate reductase [Gemmatimonadota bacterium]
MSRSSSAPSPDTILEIIVASDDRLGIGRGGTLPWHLKGDMVHFKRLTCSVPVDSPKGALNAVVMGRKTWESIPIRFRPLPGRLNHVLTRRRDIDLPEGVLSAPSFDDALLQLRSHRPLRIFVLGGGEIYRAAFDDPRSRILHWTRVRGDHGCDTHLPDPIAAGFRRIETKAPELEGEIEFRIERWCRGAFESKEDLDD